MEKRAASLALALAALFPVPVARADLTVSFATDGPAPAMSVTVQTAAAPEASPEPEPERSPELSTSTATAAATATSTSTPTSADTARSTPTPTSADTARSTTRSAVEARFVRVGDGSGESATLVLRDGCGSPAPDALERLSILARPRGVDAPARVDGSDPDFVAEGIRRLHPGLLPLLARLAERFPGRAIEIVSGYRPGAREGSRHRFGRALDLRVAGTSVDEVAAFLEPEPDTGVGLYPTSGFVHLDVRTERVRWVDDSGPGQAAHVVRTEVGARSGAPAPPAPAAAPDAEPAAIDVEAIERAMRAADAIRLDLDLGR